jgi:short subunit dehydrogenase-like uncharacterized protein
VATEWMIYGASGFTGQLAAREAIRRGHRPILAGRSADGVRSLAAELNLPHAVFDLSDAAVVRRNVRGLRAVLHCAGPFVHTGEPVMRACLAEGAHYLDITGEIPVFQKASSLHGEAVNAGVTLLPGVGFDVIPTDCMARYVATRLPGATRLELAFAAVASPSPGTARSMVEMLPSGTMVRQEGNLVSIPPGQDGRMIRFSDKERHCIPVSWGDLETAVHTTGLKDITAYMAFPRVLARAIRWTGPLLQSIFRVDLLRNAAGAAAHFLASGPNSKEQSLGRSYVYACASNDREKKEAWLETMEAYAFTARSAVLAAERTVSSGLRGYFTPALAFGEDFVLQIEGSIRSEQAGDRDS